MSSRPPEADLAVHEAAIVLSSLDRTLKHHDCTALDVIMIHMYLSEKSHFQRIIQHDRDLFGVMLSPSRSCVATGRNKLPGGRRVSTAWFREGVVGISARRHRLLIRLGMTTTSTRRFPAANATNAMTTSKLRKVLPVQSRSHWAAVCARPSYGQVNMQ